MKRSRGYDDYDRPHHPRCSANPDNPKYRENCQCEDLADDDYAHEMERRVDKGRDRDA